MQIFPDSVDFSAKQKHYQQYVKKIIPGTLSFKILTVDYSDGENWHINI